MQAVFCAHPKETQVRQNSRKNPQIHEKYSFSVICRTKRKENHIFQKAQVTSNKMEPKKRHHFLAQFFMAFLVVWFVLFRLLAFGTIK